jgi:hypothetical protein
MREGRVVHNNQRGRQGFLGLGFDFPTRNQPRKRAVAFPRVARSLIVDLDEGTVWSFAIGFDPASQAEMAALGRVLQTKAQARAAAGLPDYAAAAPPPPRAVTKKVWWLEVDLDTGIVWSILAAGPASQEEIGQMYRMLRAGLGLGAAGELVGERPACAPACAACAAGTLLIGRTRNQDR